MNDTTIPRMETIKKTAELFGLPVHFVRCKVASGEVVAVRAGRRILVNVDKFAEYLNTNTIHPEADETNSASRIKPIGR
ncbi:MAG: helix-turn-helix domain-containing protein [Oscillospiraceae bacterium]